MAYKIGFANVMYTLWEVQENDRYTTYNYIKTISKDLDKVNELYPDAEIDMNLKGSHSFVVGENSEPFQPNMFMCGKYKHMPIYDENREPSEPFGEYVAWLFSGLTKGDINEEYVIKALEQNGFHADPYEDYYGNIRYIFYSAEDWKRVCHERQTTAKFMTYADRHEPLVLHIESNCSCNGIIEVRVGDDSFNAFFGEIKPMSYNSVDYYIPAVNGKGKLVKNKTICVTDYEFHKGKVGCDINSYSNEQGTINLDIECNVKHPIITLRNVLIIKKFQALKENDKH